MRKWYRTAGALLFGACAISQANAQTHYGVGAGTQAQVYSHFGVNAGKVSTGAFNTFIGQESGAGNTTGNGNSFVGFKSGIGNLTGIDNAFFGSQAGYANSTGSQNTFIGKGAGLSNVGGFNNTYLGFQSGAGNITGTGNCAVGFQANFQGTGGNYNSFLGSNAGESNTGSDNVAIGFSSGYQNAGNFNVFAGNYAGFGNTVGSENTYLGDNAGYHGSIAQSNTYVGSKSGFFNLNGTENVFIGAKAGYNNASGQNVFVGYHAGEWNVGGQMNTYLGYEAGGSMNLVNATAIGASSKVTASNSLVLGRKANVGIGISAPSFQLHLSTDAAAKAGSPDWIIASDSRLKKNVTNFTDGLDLLRKIRPVWFQYNGQAGIETGNKRFVGIIAQEMQKIAPYTIGSFIYQDSLGNESEYLDYDANAVTYILINSVKEQQRVIEEKETRITALEKSQQGLLERLEALEHSRSSSATDFQSADTPYLEQNVPNGFSRNTSIRYYIPESVKMAVLNVYNAAGAKIHARVIAGRGNGEVVLSARDLEYGVLVYELMVDGKSTGGKKMLIE
jgi:hypothetical protein